MSGHRKWGEIRRKRVERWREIYGLALAGAWDNDPRATVLVTALRNTIDALRDYGRHKQSCAMFHLAATPKGCDCGYEAIQTALSGPDREETT